MEEKKQRLEREVEKMRVEIESAIQGHSEANPEVARIKSELELDRRLRELVDKNLGLRGEGIAARSRAQRLGRRDISPNARSKTVRLTGGGGAGRTAAAASGRGMTAAANARPSASLRSRPPF
uniref:Uncharacterized protein n=3 Tax=Palpitomonas bilix TaxID=652834 RepID=A0A7S3D5B8_9EUKA|mmetsp:Transcript_21779/g.56563  ORF Transcript_21779/g.56563 Transcript_21779/m.56563 type:complete len:123 (+) Transcript_21779:161-529(+)